MNARWNELLATLQRPSRPLLARCRARAEAHALVERRNAEDRAAALADCRERIERARAVVFAAGDGFVGADMTALEREWRTLVRREPSPEARTRALWNAVAPRRWADRLRFTPEDVVNDAELTVALASDPDGVERAEACASQLASALRAWGVDLAPVITWTLASGSMEAARASTLFAAPLHALETMLSNAYGGGAWSARGHRVHDEVLAAASAASHVPSQLGEDVAFVARFDFLLRACEVDGRFVHAGRPLQELPSPAAPLVELWKTGYALGDVQKAGITLAAAPPGAPERCGDN